MKCNQKTGLLVVILALGWLQPHCAQAFYNSSTGRWISRDPISERGGKNLFEFADNEPIRRIDRLGKEALCYYDERGIWTCRSAIQCPRCRCKSVTVRYNPGGDSFGLGWYWDQDFRTDRYGVEIDVHWEVEGDPKYCRYSQNEQGTTFTVTRPDGVQSTVIGTGNDADSDYTDPFGYNPHLPGTYQVDIVWNVTFRCESSDPSIPPVTRHDGPLKLHSEFVYPAD